MFGHFVLNLYLLSRFLASCVPSRTTIVNKKRARDGAQPADPDGQRMSHPLQQVEQDYNHHPTCPICLELCEWACETHCGHAFCSRCFLKWWQRQGQQRKKVTCPLDRREVFAVFPSPSLRARGHKPSDHRYMDEKLRQYNSMMQDSWIQESWRWGARAIREWSSLPAGFKLIIVVLCIIVIIYIASPCDILPEMLFGPIGLLDDLFVIPIVAAFGGAMFRYAVMNFRRS